MTARVLVAGPPDAPPIVFVHGTRLSRTAWTVQIEALADAFRVIAMDLPAHGSRASEAFTLDAASQALAETIRDEASGRAVVVGLSLGGYVAMDLAAREPGLVRGLVLSGATAEPVGIKSLPYLGVAALMDRVSDARLDRLNTWFFRSRFPAAVAGPLVDGGFWSKGGSQALRAIVGQRFIPRLAAYPGPTLIVNGAYDLPFRLYARSFAAAARDPRRARIARASHLANLERPAAFSAMVRRFVDSLPG